MISDIATSHEQRLLNRAVKAAQGWRCADCGAQHGARRGGDGAWVRLAVVEREGRHVALCGECRRGLREVTR